MPELRGRDHHQQRQKGDHVGDPEHLMRHGRRRAFEQHAQRVPHKGPGLEGGAAVHGDAGGLDQDPGDSDHKQQAEDECIFGARLAGRSRGANHIATERGQRDAGDEHQAEEIEDRRVALVDAALQELQVVGQQVVDLQGHRAQEQHQEARIDHGVDQTDVPRLQHRPLREAPLQLAEPLPPQSGASLIGAAGPVGHPDRQ